VTDVQDAPVQVPPALRRKGAERAARGVLPACAGTWTAAEIMHVTGIPWLDVGLGTLAVAGVAYGKGARGGARWLLAAGAWSAVAAKLGPLSGPYLPLTDAWAVLSFCGWRWGRRHPAVTEARDWRLAREDWHETRRRWHLDRTFLMGLEKTRLGEKRIIDVTGSGKLASQIAASDVAGWVAQDKQIPRTRVKVAVHGHEGQVSVDIRERDPWKRPILHPVLDDAPEIDLSGPCTCREPFIVGQDPETGQPLTLTVWDEDGGKRVLIVATSRAGKTVLLNNLRERATKARDVLLVNLNLSKALEDKEWATACHLTALTRHQLARAMKILRTLNAIIEWRSQQPRETAVFQPSPEHPLILFIGDEIDALARYPGARELLRDIYSKGGSEAVAPVVAGQRGTAEWIGGGDIRALVDVFAVGMIGRRSEAMHAAGDIGMEMPDMSKYGEGRKGVWAIAELGGEIRTGRTFLLKEPGDLRRLAEERAMSQPELEPELQGFLGDSYVKLLSDEPFAVWARGQRGPASVVAHPRPDMPAPESEWPDGLDPANPLHALAMLTRDGVVQADDETAATLAAALDVHQRQQDTLAAYDREAEDYLSTLDAGDPLRQRWLAQGRRNAETRRQLAETAAQPVPDISHEDQVAHAEARWREIGEATDIPADMREKLIALVAGKGISVRGAADALGIPEGSRRKVRDWLERLRWEGLVCAEGKGRATRWKLVPPPTDGDGT
jgi:hypothetical protein